MYNRVSFFLELTFDPLKLEETTVPAANNAAEPTQLTPEQLKVSENTKIDC